MAAVKMIRLLCSEDPRPMKVGVSSSLDLKATCRKSLTTRSKNLQRYEQVLAYAKICIRKK